MIAISPRLTQLAQKTNCVTTERLPLITRQILMYSCTLN